MTANLPENYDDPDEFEFVERVPVTWEVTQVLDSEIGRYATFARRADNEWYLRSGTDDTPRALDVSLEFLDEGDDEADGGDGNETGEYVATVYTDDEDADHDTNPTDVAIDEFRIESGDPLVASMIEGGG